jgi:uncharacterized membrane protein YeaQ/YmgE (transglycosylase-associated protein family)
MRSVPLRFAASRSLDEYVLGGFVPNAEAMMYLIWEIAIGILAGFLAGKIMRGKGYGVLMDLLLGLVGAVVGGFVFGLLGLHGYGLIGQLVIATAGAVMLIWLVRRL